MSTSSTSAFLFAAIALAGCNAAFGLDPTVQDSDGDGVPDATDNCPMTPNSDQFDSDGDGIGDACSSCATPIGRDLDRDGYDDGCDRCLGTGPTNVDVDGDGIDDGCDPCVDGVGTSGIDANGDGVDDGCEVCPDGIDGPDSDGDLLPDRCDSCSLGPPHDEDRDGIDDACDNCPADANTSQATDTSDADTLGTACDPGETRRDRRVLFDPFLVDDRAAWMRSDAGWTVSDDAAHASGDAIRRIAVDTVADAFVLAAGLSRGPTSATSQTPFAGVVAETASGGSFVSCGVTADGTAILTVAPLAGPSQTSMSDQRVDSTRPLVVRLSHSPDGQLIVGAYACTASDGANLVATGNIVAAAQGLNPGLEVTGDAAVTWFDAITSVP